MLRTKNPQQIYGQTQGRQTLLLSCNVTSFLTTQQYKHFCTRVGRTIFPSLSPIQLMLQCTLHMFIHLIFILLGTTLQAFSVYKRNYGHYLFLHSTDDPFYHYLDFRYYTSFGKMCCHLLGKNCSRTDSQMEEKGVCREEELLSTDK